MLTEPQFFAGLLLLAVGASAALIRTRHRLARALILAGGVAFFVAGALLIVMARDTSRFRVTGVEVVPTGDYAGPCPAEQRVRVRIRTAGGAGRVALRVWADQDYDAPMRTVQVQSGAMFELVATVEIARTGLSTAYATVASPNHEVGSAYYEVACSVPTR